MPDYQAPLRDIRFVMDEMLDYPAHYARLPGGEEARPDVVAAILEEDARFAREVLLPLDQSAHQDGCLLEGGEVTSPYGIQEAYARFVDGGWPSLAGSL